MNYFAYMNEFNTTTFDIGVVMIPFYRRALMHRKVKKRRDSKVS